MTINNLDYLYAHLPAFMRRDDAPPDGSLLLKRFLTGIGEELDGFDEQLETFYQKIDPATAPQQFIDWWLYSLFGWGWFPVWFTDERRRAFYAAIARHYARRGTVAGIQDFLAAFGLRVIVEKEPQFWEEVAWDEDVWSIDGPLGIVVRLFPEAPANPADLEFWEEATWEESAGAEPGDNIQRADLDELLRFVWPLGNIIMIEDLPLGA
ncbi:MAG TPA: phage tail protein [Pyrinomonadaceae bacterium]|jgi:phage tail-like protein